MKSKRLLALLLVLITVFSLSSTVFAGPLIGWETKEFPEADLLDITFGDGTVTATTSLAGGVTVTEYSSSNTVAGTSAIGEQVVNIDGKEYTINGMRKPSKTHGVGAVFTKSELTAALSDGFTVETAFVIPEGLSGEQYFLGATSSGGFAICSYQGKLQLFIHNGSGYTKAAVAMPEPGTYCHVVGVFDATAMKSYLYVNGELVGSADVSKFNPGSYFGTVGIGATTASATNITNYGTPTGTVITELNMYNDPLSADEAAIAYSLHLAGLTLREKTILAPDVLDITFGDGTVSGTTALASGVTVKEYSKSGTEATVTAIGDQTVTIAGKEYTVKGLKKPSGTHTVGVNFTKSELTDALSDGFTVETAFVVPEGLSGEQMFIGATTAGGFGVESINGQLAFFMRSGSSYASAKIAMPAAGTYCHVVGVYDAVASKINMYLNGELVASATAAQFTPGGYHGAIGIGATTASASNFTNYPVPANTVITELNLYNESAKAEDAAVIYNKHLRAVGVDVPSIEDPDDEPVVETTDKILEVNFGDGTVSALSCLNSGVTAVNEYSSNGNIATTSGIGNQTVTINGKEYNTKGLKKISTTNVVGVQLNKDELTAALSDGFTVETSFVVPAGLSGEQYFVGASNAGGFGVGHYGGKLCFYMYNGGWKSVKVDMPAVGTYCHVVSVYDATAKQMLMYLNGKLVGTTAVTGFGAGGYFGSVGIGGATASATNFTKYTVPKDTIITGVTIHNNAFTEADYVNAYKAHLAQYGIIATPVYEKDYTDDFEPVIRFMVTSDTHIQTASDGRATKTAHAIRDAYSVAVNSGNHYEELDAIVIAGDISDNGKPSELQAVKSVLDGAVQDGTELVLTAGNHEYYTSYESAAADFEAYLGETPRSHKVINGYHFIAVTVDGNGYRYSADQQNWLREELAKAAADTGTDKPIFVVQHIPQKDTILGSDTDYWGSAANTVLDSILKDYPQAVVFAGHSHMPLNDEASILQRDYTMLNTGTLKLGDTSFDDRGAKIALGDGSNLWNVSHVYIVEVDAQQNTRIRIYDIEKNEFIGETYMLEGYTKADFKYTAEKVFDIDGSDLFWEDDAKIEILSITSNLISFEFPTVSEESFTTRAFKMIVKEKATGKEVATRYTSWSYWNEDYTTTLSSGIGGLEPNTEYTLEIYGANSKYRVMMDNCILSETPLTVDFKTNEVATGDPVADVLDVKFDTDSNGKAVVTDQSDCDAYTMTTKVNSTPTVQYDDTIGMNAITFETNDQWVKMSDLDHYANSLAYCFTVEGYLKVNDWNVSNGDKGIMGSQQGGGFGFNMVANTYDPETDTGVVRFEIHNGAWRTVSKTVETGKYYHYVAVYDGETVTYYVNGVKIAKINCEAPLVIQDNPARSFFLGADTTAAGNQERQSRSSVALARIYSQPLTDEQVEGLWDDVKETRDPNVYPDDFSDDPEMMYWEAIDDEDTNYVTFKDPAGNVHNHENDNNSVADVMVNGEIQSFSGSNLFNNQSHAITGDVMCKLNFTGTAFRYVLYYRGPAEYYGTGVDVYIDGEYYDTVTDINGNDLTSRYVALEVTDLKDKAHEITFVSNTGARVMMDCFEVVMGEGTEEDGSVIPEIPSGTIINTATDLFKLESTQDREFVAFEPTKTTGYAAYFMRAKMKGGKTYTVSFKAISNTKDLPITVELENIDGVDPQIVKVEKVDEWVNYTVEITPTVDWNKHSRADVKEYGYPLRVYVNTVGVSQTFIDDLKIEGSGLSLKQNFKKADHKDTVTWLAGKATHIPAGYEAYDENEVLGFNELVGGDFEDAAHMKYWWSRTDWNGGTWQRKAGVGFEGSAGLVATGKGPGTNEYNAGIFYTIAGEGSEASLPLTAGKTYVLTYKVFRPEGVDAYVHIDLNEGQVIDAAASQNGVWETVTARFVAPEGAVKIRLVANSLAKGEKVYVDDIELRQVGGDPNGIPNTSDNMMVVPVVLAMVVSVLGLVVITIKKRTMFAKH